MTDELTENDRQRVGTVIAHYFDGLNYTLSPVDLWDRNRQGNIRMSGAATAFPWTRRQPEHLPWDAEPVCYTFDDFPPSDAPDTTNNVADPGTGHLPDSRRHYGRT
ncbi:hypothetical protein [Streptomyces nogalater]|uniref:Uncharacterized protein n=1 Tax=Streptomyces nogalater TaxID=38314 RepID=A0ABW0WT66_STRNO